MLCIATNAGVEGAIVVGKLLEQDNLDIGYDAAKGRLLLYFSAKVGNWKWYLCER